MFGWAKSKKTMWIMKNDLINISGKRWSNCLGNYL